MPADLWKAFLVFKPMNISIIDTVSFCLFNKLPPCFLNSLILLSTQHLPKTLKYIIHCCYKLSQVSILCLNHCNPFGTS